MWVFTPRCETIPGEKFHLFVDLKNIGMCTYLGLYEGYRTSIYLPRSAHVNGSLSSLVCPLSWEIRGLNAYFRLCAVTGLPNYDEHLSIPLRVQ